MEEIRATLERHRQGDTAYDAVQVAIATANLLALETRKRAALMAQAAANVPKK